MEQTDYYNVLGVDRQSTTQQIKDAYRHLAFKYHPDRNKDHGEDAEKMKSLNEAYAVLSHPEKRREYDSLRQQFGSSAYGHFRQSYTDQDIFSGSDVHHIFEEMARSFGLRGVNDIFRDFYGPGFKSSYVKAGGVRGHRYVFMSRGPGRKAAPFTGKISGKNGGGIGRRISRFVLERISGFRLPEKGEDMYASISIDPQLAAKGGPYAYFHRRRSKKIVITIPRGITDGRKVRLAGLGAPGRDGGEPGDLYIQIKFQVSIVNKLKRIVKTVFNALTRRCP